MKNLLYILILAFTLLGCKEALKPVEVIPTPILPPVEIITIDTTAYATKEPFVNIKDRGFEAYLVVYGIDKDNQINGKLAVEDANQEIEYLFLNTNYLTKKALKLYEFLRIKYKLETFVDNQYSSSKLDKLVIANLDDLKSFPNVKYISTESVVADSVIISHENKITQVNIANKRTHYVNLNACKELSKLGIDIEDSDKELKLDIKNLKNITSVNINGNVGFIDFKNNENLIDLYLSRTKLSGYDFSGVKNLKILYIQENLNMNELILPENIYKVQLNMTGIRKLNFSNYKNLREMLFFNNSNLKTLDVSGSSNVYICNSSQNPLLTQILLNPEQKIDTLGGSHGGRFWLKDPWTKWEFKK